MHISGAIGPFKIINTSNESFCSLYRVMILEIFWLKNIFKVIVFSNFLTGNLIMYSLERL